MKRTIKTSKYSVHYFDCSDEIVKEEPITVCGNKSEAKISKAFIQSMCESEAREPASIKVLCVTLEEVNEHTYHMSDEEFIQNATILEN